MHHRSVAVSSLGIMKTDGRQKAAPCLHASSRRRTSQKRVHSAIRAADQKPAKNQIGKFVKLADHTCAFKDLTNFEYVVHAMTKNRNEKTREITLGDLNFGGF